jgi:hypothetical protein
LVAKIARIFAIIIVGIILLNIMLFILFSIPAVQKRAADFALKKFTPVIGTEVSLEGIRIRLFNTVELKGLYVEDLQQDTLLYAEKIAARIHPLDLLRNKVTVQKAGLENFVADVHRATPDDPFNFQFIIDAFTKEEDTTVVKKEKSPWRITANDVVLKNGWLRYNILSSPLTPGQFNMDHLDVRNLHFKGKIDFLSMEDMQAEVNLLTFSEQNTGLSLNDLEATFRAEGTLMTSDRVSLTLNRSDIRVTGARYDTESKEFSLAAKSSLLDLKDMAVFSPRFAGLNEPLSFDVDAEGQLPQVTLHKAEVRYGADTHFDISGSISDYSNLNNSDVNVDVRTFSVSQADLENFMRIGVPDYASPPQLYALGNLDLQMQAQGKLSDFRYDGFVETEQGNVTLNGVGRIGEGFKNLSFVGPVAATRIQLANILGEGSGVDDATMRATMKVSVRQDSRQNSIITVTADGSIQSITYKDYVYTDLYFNGTYSGDNITANVNTDTEQNKIDLFADISFGQEMKFEVKGNVDRLDLSPFIAIEGWENPSLVTRINAQLAGNSIDDMTGTVVIDSTSLSDSSFIYNPGPIYLQALADEGEGKKLQLMSSFLEAEMTGDYYFSTIGSELMHALHPHLPSLIAEPEEQQPGMAENAFQFNLVLKNTEDLSYAFALPFYNVEPATITGSVNMAEGESVKINAYVPRLMFGNNDIRETKIDIQSGPSSGIGLNANTYLVQNNGYIHARLDTDAVLDSVNNRLAFEMQQSNTQSKGELLITMGFLRDPEGELASNIRIHPATVLFNEKNIDFNDATIAYRKEHITISNFGIREEGMLLLGIDGVASKSEADNIRIYFNNTELANILAAFNISNFAGSINGDIYVRQALEKPMIRTEDLRIEHITVYNDTIGTLQIEANWDQLHSGLGLNAYLTNKGERNLDIKGFIPTGDESPLPMDVNFLVENFDLYAIRPFTTSIFSELSGHLNSNIQITGSLSEPVTEGWLGINEGVLKVAYTNVTYYVSDTIQINRDNVGLTDLVIRDQNNHTATLNVSLSHTNFGRMVYNAGIRLNDFMLLNNGERTDLMAYGNLRLSGELNITGSPTGIYGDGYLTNESRSKVTVVLPQTAKATEYSGIVYINTPEQTDSLAFLRRSDDIREYLTTTTVSSAIPLVMRLRIDLTPLLEAEVVLDPTTGNALEVSGEGELNVHFNSRSTPPALLYGDYVISQGKFHYNLQNLRTIDFNIREGSTLTMTGNPLNTQFNIIAYHPVKADLTALSPTFATELANTRVAVNALLQIKGDLEGMDLQYDIELPESSSDIQQRVKSFIKTEEEKILQFAYLATSGSFIPAEGSPDMNFGSNMFTKFASNTLSRGLDALFASALSDNWTISTNLETVDGSFDNVRMGVDVSTRLLNDRLRISTNLSYGDNSTLASQQAFMGEFELEYDLKNWLMLRAFNRANERFYSRTPTTQGVGVVVTKEAKTFRNLFNFRFGRKEE